MLAPAHSVGSRIVNPTDQSENWVWSHALKWSPPVRKTHSVRVQSIRDCVFDHGGVDDDNDDDGGQDKSLITKISLWLVPLCFVHVDRLWSKWWWITLNSTSHFHIDSRPVVWEKNGRKKSLFVDNFERSDRTWVHNHTHTENLIRARKETIEEINVMKRL